LIVFVAALIGAALLIVRILSAQFYLGTTTVDHPYLAFYITLTLAGVVWMTLIPIIRSHTQASHSPSHYFWFILLIGLCLRGIFMGSTPIYEDDWNRYLWDGAVAVQGVNPYLYTPEQVMIADENAGEDILKLAQLSEAHDDFVERINNPALTTIYPPLAIAAFTISAKISLLNLDALRLIFLLSEGLTLFLLVKALVAYGRSPVWSFLYAFNPLVIYVGMNAAHMDILLVPCFLWALLAIKRRPFWAGVALAAAAAIKIWPLVLAPIFYRQWLKKPTIYIGSAVFITGLSALCLSPMLLHLGENSGTSAYAQNWQVSSFLFPVIDRAISTVMENSGFLARILVALSVVSVSLWFGFFKFLARKPLVTGDNQLPSALLILTLIFFLLSPTGYPWYAIWFMAFLPFTPLYGAAFLMATLPLYYVRFALGEAGQYHIYTDYLVPLQFGLPILILVVELFRARKKSPQTSQVKAHA